MEFTVCPADPSALPELERIENASFTCPWSEEAFLSALDAETVAVSVCLTEDGRVAGFFCLMTVMDEGELINIAVSPSFRRMGAAQQLLDHCLAQCREKSVSALYLEVRESNTPARNLYRKNDFMEIGVRRDYYEKPRESAVLMRRALDPEAEGTS